MKTPSLACATFIVLLAGCRSAGSAPAPDVPAAMEAAAQKLLSAPLLHAASIAVVYRGKATIVHRGELEAGKGKVPDDATLYEIGSVSKTFAGMLLAKAVLEGKVSLDDEVQKYLPSDYPNLHAKGREIRIRHLVTHTSGLPNMLPLAVNAVLEDFADHAVPARLNAVYAGYSQQAFWRDLAQVRPGPLGEGYAYSSAASELVAHILERVYQAPYEVLLTGFLARELGMGNTRMRVAAADAPRLAPGYHSDNPVPTTPMPQLAWGAAGNLKSTMPDMISYLRFQLGASAVAAESQRPLHRFADDFSIAYFWNIGNNRQLGTHYVHHGGVPRAQGYAYVVPKYQLGVYIVTNQSGNGTAKALESAVAGIFDTVEALERK